MLVLCHSPAGLALLAHLEHREINKLCYLSVPLARALIQSLLIGVRAPHPCGKDRDAARMGNPFSRCYFLLARLKPPQRLRPVAVVLASLALTLSLLVWDRAFPGPSAAANLGPWGTPICGEFPGGNRRSIRLRSSARRTSVAPHDRVNRSLEDSINLCCGSCQPVGWRCILLTS